MQEGGEQTAERQGRARMTKGKLSMSAQKVYFELRMASVIYTHAFIHFIPRVWWQRERLLLPIVLDLKAFIKKIRLR